MYRTPLDVLRAVVREGLIITGSLVSASFVVGQLRHLYHLVA